MPITYKKKLLFLLVALSLLFRFTESDPSSECRTVVDLCLVVDGSDSISKGDYETQRDATANLMTNLDIGDNRARVGIIVFSTTIAEEFPFNSDKELLKKKAQNLPHPRDGTNTALAIKTMRAVFKNYGRPDAPWIGIVITDGISKDPKLTMEEAQKAREEGISLIAVGITTLIDSNELLNIAGVESRVLKLESFDELKGALAGLAKTICPCDTPPVITHTVISPGPRTVGTVRVYECLEGYRGVGSGQIDCLENSTWTIPTLECVACPEPPLITNAVVDSGDNLIKTLRNFRCNPGYIPSGPTVIECLANTTWSIPQFECIICGDTPIVPHSMVLPGPHLIDTVRNYECENGYIAVGPTNIKCKTDATWSPPEFQCVACLDPPDVPNAVVDVGSNLIGALRSYQCVKGFLAKGKTSIVCQADATWSPPEFICDVCGETPVVPNAVITKGDHFIGSVRVYQCDNGFLATGPTEIICQEDGLWSITSIQCIACIDPPLVPNSVFDLGSNLIGSVRTYTCKDGFLAKGKTSIICQPDAHWSPPEFICDVCGDTPLVPNAMIRPGLNLIGTVRTYDCVEGYTAAGPTDILCLKDAMWSKPDFMCISCEDPLIVKNAMVDAGPNLIGSIRTYTCMDGYRTKGKTNIVCQADAHWSPVEFVCDACPEPPLVQNAVVEPGSYLIGSWRQYICEKGYLASGPTVVECLADAAWSSPKFSCIVCGDTPLVTNALIRPGSHLIDTLRTYDCVDGYVAAGSRDILCQKNALWSTAEFVCIACDDPPIVPNALVDVGSNLIGSLRTYTCRDGFLAKGKTSLICQPDAHWSPIEFMCDPCPKPPLVENAVINPGENLVGSTRMYTCVEGYFAKGNTEITCLLDATWSAPTFVCDVCGPQPPVDNAVILPGSNLVGSFRLYQCAKGLVPSGSTKIVCQTDGTWSPPMFSCIGCGIPPLVKNAVVSPGESLIGEFRTYTCDEGLIPTGPAGILCQDNATWTAAAFICVVQRPKFLQPWKKTLETWLTMQDKLKKSIKHIDFQNEKSNKKEYKRHMLAMKGHGYIQKEYNAPFTPILFPPYWNYFSDFAPFVLGDKFYLKPKTTINYFKLPQTNIPF
ncbi:hypothetical protein CHS0354_005070 [Potamilus streckersoni]|uniref:Uncharacterized protein n=1 Tax=Potamilus streckersoni TaxID=2493646 RepID=A0AAE0VV59_9BIVA|nr:hypothetical protein CHS0354_005070 [Potamilus streckersoni]